MNDKLEHAINQIKALEFATLALLIGESIPVDAGAVADGLRLFFRQTIADLDEVLKELSQ